MLARANVILWGMHPEEIHILVRVSFAAYLAAWLLDAATPWPGRRCTKPPSLDFAVAIGGRPCLAARRDWRDLAAAVGRRPRARSGPSLEHLVVSCAHTQRRSVVPTYQEVVAKLVHWVQSLVEDRCFRAKCAVA